MLLFITLPRPSLLPFPQVEVSEAEIGFSQFLFNKDFFLSAPADIFPSGYFEIDLFSETTFTSRFFFFLVRH